MGVTKPLSITCGGKEFSSIKEFANYYGLNYSKVQYYRKRGKTPEDIIESCKFSSASKSTALPKDSPKRFSCEYDGVQYASLYEAANALGLNPAQVYELRKRNNLSPSAAIEMAVERRTAKGKGASKRAQPCVIDGVEYESREAAILAYKLPRVTVYSRMEREGISFEEALSRGRKASVYCPPAMSLFPSLRLAQTSALNQPILEELSTSLDYYRRKVSAMRDMISLLPVLVVEEDIYLFFNHEAHGLEIVSTLPIQVDMETLNAINGAYANTKIFHNTITGQITLSSFQAAKEEGQEIRPLLYAFFSYDAIRERLIRNFSASQADIAVPALAAMEGPTDSHNPLCKNEPRQL